MLTPNISTCSCSLFSFGYSRVQASRWWLHLYRLLTGQWEGHLTSPDGVPPEGPASSPVAMKSVDSVEKPVASAEWRVARASLPDWLWVGLEADNAAAGGNQEGHLVTGALAHARGKFYYRYSAWRVGRRSFLQESPLVTKSLALESLQ